MSEQCLDGVLRGRLEAQRRVGLERHLEVADGPGPWVHIDGRRLLSFCSNDYLGLANEEAARFVSLEGLVAGSGASRLVSGNHAAHEALERRLAEYVGREACLLFSSGYAANVGIVGALVGKGDVVFSDALNHASLIDGTRLSGAAKRIFPHRDVDGLRKLLEQRGEFDNALLLTDAVFSMDGSAAPLREYADLAEEFGLWWMVDEAHSVGLYGEHGRGLCHREGVTPDVLLGTFGKSFGSAGAFAAGSASLRQWLIQRARSFVFSTGASPVQVALLDGLLDAVIAGDELRERTLRHAETLRAGLRAQGWDVRGEASPIVPVVIGAAEQALRLSMALRERGFLAKAIRPPTVPKGTSRIRLVTTAGHRNEDVAALIAAFGELR